MAKAETNGAPATPRFLASPLRNLIAGVVILLGVSMAAAMAYVENGWELSDAVYMVVITVFSIGYREIGPVDTPALRATTIFLIIAGCTGYAVHHRQPCPVDCREPVPTVFRNKTDAERHQ